MSTKKCFSLFLALTLLIAAFCALTPVFAGGADPQCPKCYSQDITILRNEYETEGNLYIYCNNCKQEGVIHEHKMNYSTIEPDCIHSGRTIMRCVFCDYETGMRGDPALGHDFQKVGGFFKIKYVCKRCGEEKYKLNVLPLIAILAVAGGAVFAVTKKKKNCAGEAAAAAASAAEFELPELSRKGVLYAAGPGEFLDYLKEKRYIKLILPEEAEKKPAEETAEEAENPILAAAKSEEPDLVILSVKDAAELEELNALLEADAEEENLPDVAVLTGAEDSALTEALAKLQEDEKIANFMSESENFGKILTAFVLPLYKPELSLEDGLESAAKIADKLGIPFAAKAASLIQTGADLKDALDKDPDISSGAELLSVISGIMGWDQAASAAEGILTAADVKSLAEEEKSRQKKQEE